MLEKKGARKTFLIVAAVLIGVVIGFFTIASFVLEPLLKKRLHSLITNGSNSLYRYSLGSLHADVFGANVNVKDLKIWVDSNRFRQLRMAKTLPSLTMGLDMKEGKIRGISLLSILFGKKLKIHRISSEDGELVLARHYTKEGPVNPNEKPFWKSIKPGFDGISIEEIKLENIRLGYWDLGRKDVHLRFSRCDALLKDIRIDSAMLADTTRLGYLGHLSFRLQGLAYVSADSVYKLGAANIHYTSDNRQLDIDRISLEPSDSFQRLLRYDTVGKTYFSLQSGNIRFQNIRLEQFINANTIRADSLVVQSPVVSVYFDRSAPKDMRSKVGNFPHQLLAKAPMTLSVRHLSVPGMQFTYTEKNDRTGNEGQVSLNRLSIQADNLTNDPAVIKAAPVCTINASGNILGNSAISAQFRLYLNDTLGRFEVEGAARNLAAPQLNPLSESLASMRIQSLNIQEVLFSIKANDDSASGIIRMRYSNLQLQVLKTAKPSDDPEVNQFLSKLLNQYMVYPANPGPDGTERTDGNVHVSRLLSHSFFGLIWKTIFAGMQNILLKP